MLRSYSAAELVKLRFIILARDKLPCDLPKIISPQGQNHTDVILSGDKPGRRIDTTRQRSFKLTDQNTLNILSQNFRKPSSAF